MATIEEPSIDAPIPGMGMTHELGARPWQNAYQFTTIEEALDFYIPRLSSEEVRRKLFDVLEMGIPVTSVANSMQLSAVMEGKHSVDVGMLVIPILMEFIMLMADEVGIEYDDGMKKDKGLRESSIDLAMSRLEQAGIKGLDPDKKDTVETKEEEDTKGLMARRKA